MSHHRALAEIRFRMRIYPTRAVWVFVLLALPAVAFSQPSPRVASLLDRLRAYAEDYRDHLPSLSCEETIVSQWVRDGKVKQEVRAEATLRELRDDSNRGEFSDHYEFKTVNGRRAKLPFKAPLFVYSAFSKAIGFSGGSEQEICYDYRLDEQDAGPPCGWNLPQNPI